MTAEPTSAAVGLVERYAAAFVSAVPDQPEDDGFFGPASVTWRLAADLSAPVAGLRSVLIQALHPLAMAGVDQHSGWRTDPVGRLAATSAYLATLTYGDQAAAVRSSSGRTPSMYSCRPAAVSGMISRGTPSSSAETAISPT